jgi:hypothetical protein
VRRLLRRSPQGEGGPLSASYGSASQPSLAAAAIESGHRPGDACAADRRIEGFMRFGVIAVCLGVGVFVAACGKSDDKVGVTIAGNGGNATISGNGAHMTMKTDDGKTTVEVNSNGIGNVAMPDFAPLYPGAKVLSSVTGSGNGGGAMVIFTAAAAPADIIAFYKQKTAAAGMSETLNASEGNAMTFIAGKDKKTVQVIASKSDSGTQVQLIWAKGS